MGLTESKSVPLSCYRLLHHFSCSPIFFLVGPIRGVKHLIVLVLCKADNLENRLSEEIERLSDWRG